ncbi:2-amino-4-hydroxy-6-hydroxymethyldihydropteridine diphosphokinase [Yoonia sp.]|uniref:2-amino-4-hydroxy-6- hydroxymethyldihydropteridine diphosphokinase n=1 Tax=Yoonia sp. TaxID=2212373 RepID=UPI003F6CA7FF
MSDSGHVSLICFGSNATSVLGDPRETVTQAMASVAALSETAPKSSALYQTPAFPAGAGPDFVNAAMAITTLLSPEAMLAQLHLIESRAGRVREKRWGQRTLDLDLIAMDDLICPDRKTQDHWRTLPETAQQTKAPEQLILPHPRMQDRSFVLVPLSDVAPDWMHPVLGRTVQALLEKRPESEQATVVPLP